MKIAAVIDRFEGDKTVLLINDGQEQVTWPKCLLPAGSAAGDHLIISMEIDQQATCTAQYEADELLRRILEQNK